MYFWLWACHQSGNVTFLGIHKHPLSLQRLCISGFCSGWHFVSNSIELCPHHPQSLIPLLAEGAHRPWAERARWNPCFPYKLWKSFHFSPQPCRGEENLHSRKTFMVVSCSGTGVRKDNSSTQFLTWKTKNSSEKQFTVSVVLGLVGLVRLCFHPKQMMCLIKKRIQAIVYTSLLKSSHLES